VATFEQFSKVFAPLIIMEEHMSELQSETGYIAKILSSKKNAQWRGYVFQKDDNKAYSITLNEKVPADLRAELAILSERDYVTFHYKPSQSGDKTYYNIYGLERPEKQQDEPSNDKPSPTPQVNLTEMAKQALIVSENALTASVEHVGHKLQHGLYPGDVIVGEWADKEVLRIRRLFAEDTLTYANSE
jgi:hypothetical protein